MSSRFSIAPHTALLLALGVSLSMTPALFAAEGSTKSATAEIAKTVSESAPDVKRASLNAYELALVGIWQSEDTSRGAAAGTMTLAASRHLKLQIKPIGAIEIPALEGTWSADADYLYLEVASRGKARISYRLMPEPKFLEVQYENGMGQTFFFADTAEMPPISAALVLP